MRFLGTRGSTPSRSRRHRQHSALWVQGAGGGVMIDCSADWRGKLGRLGPSAVVLTHAHPDHAFGLAKGVPCPVYATVETWTALPPYPIENRRTLAPRQRSVIEHLMFEAFALEHSLLAPAVGWRVEGDGAVFFYAPDIISILEPIAALEGIDLYVGDGATLTRPMVRRHGKVLFGHTIVRAQLGWCGRQGVERALFTHCGAEIVQADGRTMAARVRAQGIARGVDARIAMDGLELELAEPGLPFVKITTGNELEAPQPSGETQ